MKIVVRIKSVYGEDKIYPECNQAKLFANLLGQKTLTTRDLRIIRDLGFEIHMAVGHGAFQVTSRAEWVLVGNNASPAALGRLS